MHSASADGYNVRRLSKTQNHSGIQKEAYKHATKEVGFTLEMEIQFREIPIAIGSPIYCENCNWGQFNWAIQLYWLKCSSWLLSRYGRATRNRALA